jgi:hypothetical protein
MPRRSTPRQLAKAQEQFKAAVTTYFVSLGARPGMFYEYELDTPAGLLHISIYEDWVACRFDDVARGTAFSEKCGHSCNPHTGKWNFHFGDGTAASLAPATVLPQLDYFFDCLLHLPAIAS